MRFVALPRLTTIDYDMASHILFTTGCNLACPACHAGRVKEPSSSVTEEQVLKYLEGYPNPEFVKGLVICGGEPTAHIGLENFLRKVRTNPKTKKLSIKLDTNGTNPDLLVNLARDGLVDYVALDVKGPPQLYAQLVGKEDFDLRDGIEKAIGIVPRFPGYEFRTTLFPLERKEGKISFMTPKEIQEMALWVGKITSSRSHKHYLQTFKAQSKEQMIDPKFSKESLARELWQTPNSLMQEAKAKLGEIGYCSEIR